MSKTSWIRSGFLAAIAAGAIAGVPAGASGDAPSANPATSAVGDASTQNLALSIAQLGDIDPAIREAATKRVSELGAAALPALRAAAAGDSPEVAARAGQLLRIIRFGFGPETPEPIRLLVTQYQSGNDPQRLEALQRLGLMGWPGYRVLARLRRQESDPVLRDRLTGMLGVRAPSMLATVRTQLAEGREDEAQALLAEGVIGSNSLMVRSQAALLLSRGKLDDEIHRTQEDVGDAPSSDDAYLLACMFRAKGDADETLRYALLARTGIAVNADTGGSLVRELLLDQKDWAKLIAAADATINRNDNEMVRRLGMLQKLSYARLSGNHGLLDETVASLGKAVLPGAAASQNAYPLLLNDRVAEGLQMLTVGKDYAGAFHLYAIRGQYDEAKKMVDAAISDQPGNGAALELSEAKRLTWLGDTDAATAIVDRVSKELQAAPAPGPEGDLIEAELALGLKGPAIETAVAALGTPTYEHNAAALLDHLSAGHGVQAMFWRTYFGELHPAASTAEALHQIVPLFSRKLPVDQTETLLREAANSTATSSAISKDERQVRMLRIAETALAVGRSDLADDIYSKLSGVCSSWIAWEHLGNRQALKDWPKAAACYAKAVQFGPAEPPCLWLHGWAVLHLPDVQPGDAQAARKEMSKALELLLADDRAWLDFIGAITAANADATGDAEPLRKRMRKLCDPDSQEYCESYRLSARALLFAGTVPEESAIPNAAGEKGLDARHYLEAADLLTRSTLRVEWDQLFFPQVESYLAQPVAVHSCRARGLIIQGDIAVAMSEANLCLAALPLNDQVAIDLVPALDRKGRSAEGDALFQKIADAIEAALARHPRCAELHNGLAWMSAKCGRNLDAALDHAQKANNLAPETVAYMDTLAEVHWRRGERQRAVDLMKRCIELDPHFAYLQGQLKRFNDGPAHGFSPR